MRVSSITNALLLLFGLSFGRPTGALEDFTSLIEASMETAPEHAMPLLAGSASATGDDDDDEESDDEPPEKFDTGHWEVRQEKLKELDLWGVLQLLPQCKQFAEQVKKHGVDKLLQTSKTPITVLCPKNRGRDIDLDDIPMELTKEVVLYHMLPKRVTRRTMLRQEIHARFQTMAGKGKYIWIGTHEDTNSRLVTFGYKNYDEFVGPLRCNTAEAKNGVVHVLEEVMREVTDKKYKPGARRETDGDKMDENGVCPRIFPKKK